MRGSAERWGLDTAAAASRPGKVEIPVLLPYMADRSLQREQLADLLEHHDSTNPRRPLALLIYGDEREAHRAFIDRLHFYLPGWEVPKIGPESASQDYGFITDYFCEIMHELRRVDVLGGVTSRFDLFDASGSSQGLTSRDVRGVHKTLSGLLKLMYPHGEVTDEQLEESGLRERTLRLAYWNETGIAKEDCLAALIGFLRPRKYPTVVDDGWQRAMHFTLFEADAHYEGQRGGPNEPREILVVDVTDDDTVLDLAGNPLGGTGRSEERRVGEECRSRWSPDH